MFHIELRQPPHRIHRFNLTERELREAVLRPWVRGERIEVGERGWSADAGAILVLEGQEIPIGQLTMNRGWSVAQREGRDVTERLLAGVRAELGGSAVSGSAGSMAAGGPLGGAARGGAAGQPAGGGAQAGAGQRGVTAQQPAGATGSQAGAAFGVPIGAAADFDVLADALGLELLRCLGETPMSLVSAWRTAAERHPQMPLGASLDLAQRAVASLTRSRLVKLGRAGGEPGQDLHDAELDAALSAAESWTTESGPEALWLRRG
jgi:hypothetical protein